LDAVEMYLSNTLFIAEAIPCYHISFAPDHFSAYLGAEIQANENSLDTTWVVPFVKDWDDVEIQFRQDSYWWEKTVEFITAFRKRFDGRVILVPPSIQGGLDCLSAVRGVNELLMDIIDTPEKIKRALEQVAVAVNQVQQAYRELVDPKPGYMNRHMMYSAQMTSVPQCDFSCMISPQMFNEFQMPVLKKELENLGPVDYHLDGPGAIQHLEFICMLDKINVIQWQPGAGEAAEKDWWDLYETINDLGKGIYLFGLDKLEIAKKAWLELNNRQIYVDVICDTPKQAYEIHEEFETLASSKI
jgi:5-methyltetrahydrofolate--homocysteine methyltransferase